MSIISTDHLKLDLQAQFHHLHMGIQSHLKCLDLAGMIQ